MEAHGVRRIPIIDVDSHGKKHCVGLVTLDDLIATDQVSSDLVSRIVRSQIHRRRNRAVREIARFRVKTRSNARKEQTEHVFMKHFVNEMKLDRFIGEEVTIFLLGVLVRRLHFVGAAHFIAQLPERIQDQLLELPTGPDRSISVSSILDELIDRFHFDEATAQTLLVHFCIALESILDQTQLKHVKEQLPEELRSMFKSNSTTQAA